jgi:CheY-like chemotaxis protein
MAETDPPALRVMCVDDHPDTADSLAILLELVGYEAKVCYDGESALAAAEEFRPDACILDLTMPGIDGVEVGRRLRERPWARNLPLVAVTALGNDEARRRTSEAGFDLHLTKPVDPDRLANVLADIVILRGEYWLADDPQARQGGGKSVPVDRRAPTQRGSDVTSRPGSSAPPSANT